MSSESDLVERLHTIASGFEMQAAPPDDDVQRGRRRRRRHRALASGAAGLTVVLVVGVTAAVGERERTSSDDLGPVEPSVVVAGDVPVWYDDEGLHRGDVVEATPVEIEALALVRTGALYLDPRTDEVWFHPWGGKPHVVGHNSLVGPGGDPFGDTAVWLDGDELVIYDTAVGRERSRTPERHAITTCNEEMCGEHYRARNGFIQVTPDHISWNGGNGVYRHDVLAGATSLYPSRTPKRGALLDMHDDIEILADYRNGSEAVILRVPGRAEQRYPQLEPRVRLSPGGEYALAVRHDHAGAIIDTGTGELWTMPVKGYPWIAWSYGDIALVDNDGVFHACDVSSRSCEVVPVGDDYLLPNT
jgi:hypothetical protein